MPLLEMITAGPVTWLSAFDSSAERQRWTLRAGEHGVGGVELAFAEVVVLAVLAIDRRGVAGHRAVEVDRQVGNAIVALEHLQQVDQLLRAADGERGHQHHAAALDRRAGRRSPSASRIEPSGWSRSP